MYFIGGYIRIYNIKCLDSKKNSIITCIITFIIMILSIIFIFRFRDYFTRIGTTKTSYFWTPNNVLMLILSVSFFMIFTKLKIKNNYFINRISSTTLGIYLLHDGIIKKWVWKNWFTTNIYIYTNSWYIHLFISTILIFLLGFVIDIIRQFFEKYTVKRFVDLKIWPDIYLEVKKEGRKIIDKLI